MADERLQQLPLLETPALNDLLFVADVSEEDEANFPKRVTVETLLSLVEAEEVDLTAINTAIDGLSDDVMTINTSLTSILADLDSHGSALSALDARVDINDAKVGFTNALAIAATLTGVNTALTGSVSATDTILQAFGRLENRTALNDAKVTGSDRALKIGDEFTGPVLLPIGSAGAPSLAYSGDTDTGIYFASATINLALAGTLRLSLDTDMATLTGLALGITRGTITALSPSLDISETWDNASATFTALRLNVTDTASNAASLLMDLRVGGASKFSVSKSGKVIFTQDNSLPTLVSSASNTSGFGSISGDPTIWGNGTSIIRFNGNQVSVAVPVSLGATTSAPDVYLRRDAAGVLALSNTTNAQTFRITETTDAGLTNYSRLSFQTQAGNHLIRTEAGGTGTLRTLQVGSGPSVGTNVAGVSTIIHGGQPTGSGAAGAILFQQGLPVGGSGSGVTALATTWQISTSGHLLAGVDNTYDIGASGANRPRNLYVGSNILSGSNIILVNSGFFFWASRTAMQSPSDGVLTIGNNTITDFDRLQFGGITSSFPALKRSTTFLHFRLADDSGFTGLTAGIGANRVLEIDGTGLGFYGVTPIARPLLATGAGATADNIITALQNLGLVRQS